MPTVGSKQRGSENVSADFMIGSDAVRLNIWPDIWRKLQISPVLIWPTDYTSTLLTKLLLVVTRCYIVNHTTWFTEYSQTS